MCQIYMGMREEASWPLEASLQIFSPLESAGLEFHLSFIPRFQPGEEKEGRSQGEGDSSAAKGKNQEGRRVCKLGKAATPALLPIQAQYKVRNFSLNPRDSDFPSRNSV